MTTFESPLGKKTVPGGRKLREFDIPDESDSENFDFDVDAAIKSPGMKQLNFDEINAFNERLNNAPIPAQMPKQAPQYQKNQLDVEREIRDAREMKKVGKERLTEGAKRRLESLLGMIRHTREVPMGEITFVLQTLKGKETREAIKGAAVYDGTVESPYEIRIQLLARSIISIGGIEFDQFVGSSNIETKLLFVEELDDIVLNKLYDEYIIMTREAKDKFSVNNAEQAQEVISDIKK
jgi:hypothetical protein